MSSSRNSNYLGRNPESSSKDLPNAGGHNCITQRSASRQKIEEGTASKKEREADLLVREIIKKGLIEKKSKGIYEISTDLCSKIITNISKIGFESSDVRKSIFNSIWEYYGLEDTPKAKSKVSKITRLVEWMILDNRI